MILASFSGGTATVHEETGILHPIQSMVSARAALCHDIGTPRMSRRITINDAQSGDDVLSSQARRSSTYCQRACPCARREWQDRTMMPARRPQYQPLARAPKFNVTHRYSSPLAWKHNRPPSAGATRILRWAFDTSRVNWVICCSDIPMGAHCITSEILGKSMWLGRTVFAVTILTELSATSRGARPGARTAPSLPMAVLAYICLSCHAPGTWAMKPASNSSWISDCTISGWSWALFHESRQSWSGTSSGKVPVYAGQAKDAFKGSLTPNGTPWGNCSRKPASGSPKNVARRCHNCNLNGWPGAIKESRQVGNQGCPTCPQGKGPGLAGTSVVLCSHAVARQWFESNAGCHWASWTISIEVRQGDHVVEDSYVELY